MARKSSKPRKFSDLMSRYKTYDTSAGFGSLDQWQSAWESMTGEEAHRISGGHSQHDLLALLGLDRMPGSADEIKKAFRQVSIKVHPDHSGDEAHYKRVVAAYVVLKEKFD